MTEYAKRTLPWRAIGWSGAVALLATPFVAMRFTSEVNWTSSDFIFAGILFLATGLSLELMLKASSDRAYRAGAGLALLGLFLVIWANLAVGLVGSEDNPANLLFFAALLVGVAGAIVARLRAKGMAQAMIATAVSIVFAFGAAVMWPSDEPLVPHSRELVGVAIFAALFTGSAVLFSKAAQSSSSS